MTSCRLLAIHTGRELLSLDPAVIEYAAAAGAVGTLLDFYNTCSALDSNVGDRYAQVDLTVRCVCAVL